MGNKISKNKKDVGVKYRVTSNNFVVTITVNKTGKIVKTPAVLNWTLYKRIDDFFIKAFRRKWKVEKL